MFLFFQTILPLKKNCQSFRRSAVVLKTHPFSCQAKNELCPRVVLRQNAMSTRLPGKMGRPLKQFSDAVNDASLLGFSGTMTPWPGEFLFRENSTEGGKMQGLPPSHVLPKSFWTNEHFLKEKKPTGDWEDFCWGLEQKLLAGGGISSKGASETIKTFGKRALAPWKDQIERNWYQVDSINWLIQQFIQFNRPISSNFNVTTSPLGLCARIWSSTTLSGGSWELLPDFSEKSRAIGTTEKHWNCLAKTRFVCSL